MAKVIPKNATYSDVHLNAGEANQHLLFDEESINQNIALIAATPVGSKWFRPTVGSFLEQYLFEPIDFTTSDKIQTSLESILVQNLEKRVVFKKIEVLPDAPNQQYFISIEYTTIKLPNKSVKFEFALGKS